VSEKPNTKKFVGVQLPLAIHAKLQKIADGEYTTKSAVVRRLLAVAIKDEERRDPPRLRDNETGRVQTCELRDN
jgi:predicted transcriptional regulator